MAGVALGNLGNAVGASLGLAALFAVSSLAYTLIKYAGALAASSVAPALARAGRLRSSGRFLAGGTYIGLGVLTAYGGARSAG